ncbi:MAG: transposase, partial [Nitrospirae bacterium]|nr:transposase [Nitrospirota bacterium]MCL5953898.1 transposase [Nitrospirota bacterium]
SPENRTTQALFRCVSCGHAENADLNAARNILRAGHARLACGTNTSPEVGAKAQEPTEAA